MTPIFDGQVNDGKLLLDAGQQFHQHLVSLNGKRVQVTVEKIKHKRSNNQNQYYWGVVVKLIAQHTGHNPEQIHEALKQMFSPKWYLGSVMVPNSTARLDTIEFVEYTEKCRQWGSEFLNLNIPLPGEVAE